MASRTKFDVTIDFQLLEACTQLIGGLTEIGMLSKVVIVEPV